MRVTKLNKQLSEYYASRSMPKQKECYSNSFGIFTDVLRDHSTAMYCEGLAASTRFSIPLDHGWIEVKDDQDEVAVIDVTWQFNESESAVYCALLRLNKSMMDNFIGIRIKRNGIVLPIRDFHVKDMLKLGVEMPKMTLEDWRSAFESIGSALDKL